MLPRVDALEGAFGVVGGEQEHHAAPFSITEEFASVYRLHPLIPDEYDVRSHRTGALVAEEEFTNIQGRVTRDVIERFGWSDLFYSFGVAHPGAVTLHNHPRALQNLTRVNGDRVDIGTIDILRDRERGVPRYNDFRDKLRARPREEVRGPHATTRSGARRSARSTTATSTPSTSRSGLLAEKPPKGFGFSDTAFRIFILMASRRLKSDRFFTTDYTPDVYTPRGPGRGSRAARWSTCCCATTPSSAPALEGCENAFAPWRKLD